uniref:Uncharacterized protein n=1 Tax=Anguilla anguilla TaxID=7936 RepID=A0A0E9XAL6_ANGAN
MPHCHRYMDITHGATLIAAILHQKYCGKKKGKCSLKSKNVNMQHTFCVATFVLLLTDVVLKLLLWCYKYIVLCVAKMCCL